MSDKILYIQTIWVPTEELYYRHLTSLCSLFSYMSYYPNSNIEFIFCGWTHKHEYFDRIVTFITANCHNKFTIIPYDHNYGKAYVVNESIKSLNIDSEYLIISDSDMILDLTCDDMFNKFINSSNEITSIRNKPFGYIAPMQKVYNCHNPNIYDNSIPTSLGNFVYPNINGGIAGGYLFISTEAWKSIKGYRYGGVCYGEDAWIMVDLIDKGYTCQVSENIWINHPLEINTQYHSWKVCQCQSQQPEYKESIRLTEEYFSK